MTTIKKPGVKAKSPSVKKKAASVKAKKPVAVLAVMNPTKRK